MREPHWRNTKSTHLPSTTKRSGMKSGAATVNQVLSATTDALVAGDRVRVAYGVFGRLGWVSSTSPGCVLVRYDDGARDVIDPTRRPVWIVR